MGRDKALVEVDPGRPLVAVTADALRAAGALEVVAVGGDRARIERAGVAWRADRYPGEGPLGGIVTALGASSVPGADPVDLVVVLACDMPGIGPGVPRALVEALAAAPEAGVAVAVVGSREQPLTACWRVSVARAVLEAGFAAGERAPRRLLGRVGVVTVPGLPAVELADVDSPDDLRRYAGRHLPSEQEPHVPDVPEVDIDALERAMSERALVVDVRELDEYTAGHVRGALPMPLTSVPDRIGELPAEAPVYVICHVGGRSARAVQFLRANGLDATNVAGGTKAWSESGRPLVTGPDPV